MTAHMAVKQVADEEYHEMVATNLDSAFFMCKLCHPLLRASPHASVVNVTSVAGVRSSGTGVVCACLPPPRTKPPR